MTLDETIKHCIEAAAKNKTLASEIGEQLIGTPFEKYKIECQERAAKYNQFAEWLTELKETKRLLKAAVEDIRHCMHSYDPCEVCSLLDKDGECPATDDDDCKEKYKWRYEAEALKLIGDNNR